MYILYFLCFFSVIFLASVSAVKTDNAISSNVTRPSAAYIISSNELNVTSNSLLTTNESEVSDLMAGNITNIFEKENMTEVSGDLEKDVDEAENGIFTSGDRKTNGTQIEEWSNTAAPKIMESGEEIVVGPAVGTAESAVILTGAFMILAAIGYGGLVAWRRMLQVKYDTSDMLITDDVYDISDLRNFEI